jgi:hypothetical protein
MKIRTLSAAVVLFAVGIPAVADSLRVDGFQHRDVTILGVKDGILLVKMGTGERSFDLSVVDQIELTGQQDFNRAELSRGQPEQAAAFYEASQARNRLAAELAEKRAAQLEAKARAKAGEAGGKTPEKAGGAGANFFDVAFQGKKVVYVLDHSGSMLDNFDFLRQEAIRAVGSLPEDSQFNVLMVSEAAAVVYAKPQAGGAKAVKDFSAKMAGYRAQGSNDDLLKPFQEAFEKAFTMKPDAIYFLTDGHFDPRLGAVIDKLNADKRVRINTLAFVNKEPSYEAQLKAIAKQHGGVYKFVSEKDLGR